MSDENDTYFMNQFYWVYNDVSQAIDEYDRLPDGIRREVEGAWEQTGKSGEWKGGLN